MALQSPQCDVRSKTLQQFTCPTLTCDPTLSTLINLRITGSPLSLIGRLVGKSWAKSTVTPPPRPLAVVVSRSSQYLVCQDWQCDSVTMSASWQLSRAYTNYSLVPKVRLQGVGVMNDSHVKLGNTSELGNNLIKRSFTCKIYFGLSSQNTRPCCSLTSDLLQEGAVTQISIFTKIFKSFPKYDTKRPESNQSLKSMLPDYHSN